jgi:hypothetical protein
MKPLRFFLFLSVAGFFSPALRAGYPVIDASNLLQNILGYVLDGVNEVNTYTSAVANVASVERFGNLKKLMAAVKQVGKTARAMRQTVKDVERLSNGDYGAVSSILSKWSDSPELVGITDSLARSYTRAERLHKKGNWSARDFDAYSRDYRNVERKMTAMREKRARERAAQAAALSIQAVESQDELVEATLENETPEDATAAATRALATGQTLQLRMQAQRDRAEAEKVARESEEKRQQVQAEIDTAHQELLMTIMQ